MSSTAVIGYGRLISTPLHVPRPQLGGRRPPGDRNGHRRSSRRSTIRRRHWFGAGAAAIAAALAVSPATAQKASLPDLNGTYRCEGNETVCASSGRTFTVTQSGAELQIKNDKGEIGSAKLTSNISLSAGPIWNMFGVLSPDSRAIQWSNGSSWRKQ